MKCIASKAPGHPAAAHPRLFPLRLSAFEVLASIRALSPPANSGWPPPSHFHTSSPLSMPSLRIKFKSTVNKWHAMVKRRIHPGDEDSASQDSQSQGESHKSKLQRIMTDASTQLTGRTTHGIITKSDPVQGGVQALATSAALVPPPDFLPPSTAADSLATPSQPSTSGSSHGMGISGSSYQNPIDLTEPGDNIDHSSQENPHPSFPDVDLGSMLAAQIETDQLLALQMQQELQRDDLEASEPCFGHQFTVVGPKQLEQFRQRLQAIRCVNCAAPLKIEASELIQRTRRMLKSSRRFRRVHVAP